MLTQVRQRATQQVHGHRGRANDDVWAHRLLLLRNGRALPTATPSSAADSPSRTSTSESSWLSFCGISTPVPTLSRITYTAPATPATTCG